MDRLILNIAIYFLGVLTGWCLKHFVNKEQETQTMFAVLISGVWTISIVAEMIISTYTTSTLIHAMMGGVTGWLFGGKSIESLKEKLMNK